MSELVERPITDADAVEVTEDFKAIKSLMAIRDVLFPEAERISEPGWENSWLDSGMYGNIEGPLADIEYFGKGDQTMANSLRRASSQLAEVKKILEAAGLDCDSHRDVDRAHA